MRFETDEKERNKMSPDEKEILDELKSKLAVDPFNLEDECKNQSILLEEVGEIVAEIKRKSRAAKERLEYIKASLSTDIRKEPEKFGIVGKATVDSVASTVLLQSEYAEAFEEMLEAMEKADAFSTLLVAVEQRKSLIRDAVSLYIHQYYSSQNLTSEQGRLGKVTEEQIIQRRLENSRRKEQDEEVSDI